MWLYALFSLIDLRKSHSAVEISGNIMASTAQSDIVAPPVCAVLLLHHVNVNSLPALTMAAPCC